MYIHIYIHICAARRPRICVLASPEPWGVGKGKKGCVCGQPGRKQTSVVHICKDIQSG